MKVDDFLLFTLDETPSTYTAVITSIDAAAASFGCRRLDTGERLTVQYADGDDPWPANSDVGMSYPLVTHDVYAPRPMDPSPDGATVVTFADGARYLGAVESVSPTTDVVFYHPPYPRVSFAAGGIVASDWERYPVGGEARTLEDCRLDRDLPRASDRGHFVDGWWSLAQQRPAFAGRIGGPIAPFAVVVHTTDMTPETWNGLVHRWTTELGARDCAHFLIGRDAAAGVLQLAPITRNANHAGGPAAGAFAVPGGPSWHPNHASVGIELHCAGAVRQHDGRWRLFEHGAPTGAALPDADVIPDPDRPGRGWHEVTAYQYDQLGLLLAGLESVLGPLPAGCVARSIEQPPAYGRFATGRRVGHVSVDAANRGDPWPPTCNWLRALP